MLLLDEHMLSFSTIYYTGVDYKMIPTVVLDEDVYMGNVEKVISKFRVEGMLLDRNKLNNQTIYLIGKNYGIEEKVGEGMEEYVERVVEELSIG